MTEPNDPVPVVSLDYRDADVADPLGPIVRLMATAAAVHGGAVAASMLFSNGFFVPSMFRRYGVGGGPLYVSQLLVVAAGAGLLAGGLMARQRRPAGRQWVLALEVAYVVLLGLMLLLRAWAYSRPTMSLDPLAYLLQAAPYTLVSAVLPVTVWVFFRRPDVAALFDER